MKRMSNFDMQGASDAACLWVGGFRCKEVQSIEVR